MALEENTEIAAAPSVVDAGETAQTGAQSTDAPIATDTGSGEPTVDKAEPTAVSDEPTVSSEFSLPEDWRDRFAKDAAGEDGDSDKLTKMLSRYSTPGAAVKALAEAQSKIREGVANSATLPDDATDEQRAEWREAQGIPATPDDYDVSAPDGVVLGERDAAIIDQMKPLAHGLNLNAEQMRGMAQGLIQAQEAERNQLVQRDEQLLTDAKSALRETWGSDYSSNISVLDNLLDQLPNNTRNLFEGGRLADGSPLTSNPAIMSFLVAKEREANPVATSVPSGSGTIQTIDSEIKDLEGQMGTDAWYKDDAKQSRYRELITARDKYNQKHG